MWASWDHRNPQNTTLSTTLPALSTKQQAETTAQPSDPRPSPHSPGRRESPWLLGEATMQLFIISFWGSWVTIKVNSALIWQKYCKQRILMHCGTFPEFQKNWAHHIKTTMKCSLFSLLQKYLSWKCNLSNLPLVQRKKPLLWPLSFSLFHVWLYPHFLSIVYITCHPLNFLHLLSNEYIVSCILTCHLHGLHRRVLGGSPSPYSSTSPATSPRTPEPSPNYNIDASGSTYALQVNV